MRTPSIFEASIGTAFVASVTEALVLRGTGYEGAAAVLGLLLMIMYPAVHPGNKK